MRIRWSVEKGLISRETLRESQEFIQHVVVNGERCLSRWQDIGEVQFHKHGDALVIRRPNGSYVTHMDYARGRQTVEFMCAGSRLFRRHSRKEEDKKHGPSR